MRATYALRDTDGAGFVDSCIDDDVVPDEVREGQLETMRRVMAMMADDPRKMFILAQRIFNPNISEQAIANKFENVFRVRISQQGVSLRLAQCRAEMPDLTGVL